MFDIYIKFNVDNILTHRRQFTVPEDMTDIIPNKDGTITIKYTPNTPGIHEMTLSHNDKTIDGLLLQTIEL